MSLANIKPEIKPNRLPASTATGPSSVTSAELSSYIEELTGNYFRFKDEVARIKSERSSDRISQTNWSFGQHPLEAEIDIVSRHRLLTEYGDFSMAYSTAFQPCLRYFGDANGLIAYKKRWGMTFALADPLVDPAGKKDLIQRFVQEHRHPVFGRPTFCQVSGSTAESLQELGYFVNEMGFDTTLPLADYDFRGKEKEWLRYADNWMRRRGYQMRECDFSEISPERIEAVSEAWRSTRTVKRKEVRFLNRPIILMDEPGVRKFYCFDSEGEVQAFVFIDPMYRNGKVIGYVTAFKRRRPDSPAHAEQALVKHIIETLQAEGIEQLRLGLSPFDGVQQSEFKCNRLTRMIFGMGFNMKFMNRFCYNVVGHAEYKRRFRGVQEQTYFASSGYFDVPRLFALIGLCGIA